MKIGNLTHQDLGQMTLPSNTNIYASKYELYLPDKKLLQEKLKQWALEEGGISESVKEMFDEMKNEDAEE